MAYTTDDWRIQVRGDLPAGEIWVNTWAVKRQDPGAAIQDAIDDLHAFYTALAGNFHNTLWKAVGATYKQLSTAVHGDGTWPLITGSDGDDSLPNQDSVRVSLSAAGGVKGGPFLSGWDLGALSSTGMLNTTATNQLISDLGDLAVAFAGHDWLIGIDRPSEPELVLALTGRVGTRFDVIRRRANRQAESYATVTF